VAERKVPDDLLQAVVMRFDPRKVILFGSRARGSAREDSDHDLLVIVDDDIPSWKLHWRSLHEARKRYRRAVDIVAYRQSTYDQQADVVGTLPHMVQGEGLVIFDRVRGVQTAE
jgi:predicted nucleotidyltransferase